MERIGNDVRYAARGLLGTPVFTVVAVLTLALGVGANSAVFTVVESVLLRPLPYRQPDRLVAVWPEANFNAAMVKRIEADVPALEDVSGIAGWEFTLVGEGDPEKLAGAAVSADHFDVLGVDAAVGRTFLAEEGQPDRAGVVVLSHDLWVRRFGGDPATVGRTVRLGGHDFDSRTVVGVLPDGYRPVEGSRVDVWVPLHGDSARSAGEDNSWYVTWRVGRLAPGATVEQATTQLRAAARRLQPEVSYNVQEEDVRTASVAPLRQARVSDLGPTLWILLGAVGLVLLVACANVSNLMLARGEARRRDLAVRQALGAGGGRLAGQLLVESLLLGLVGGGLGMVLAERGTALLVWLAPENFPRADEIAVDGSVLLFTLAVSLLATVLSGLAPALRAARRDPADALRGAGRGATGARAAPALSRWLVSAQIATAVLLVTGSGLMLRSLVALQDVDPGFEAQDVLVYRLSPPDGRFAEGPDYVEYYRRVMERLEAVPGVVSVSAIHLLPLTWSNWALPTYPDGVAAPEDMSDPNFRVVYPGWFETMEIGLVAGRTFTDADGPDDPRAAVVNQAFVEHYWPGEEALGRDVRLFSAASSPYRVIGIVDDVNQHALDSEPRPEIYLTHPQWPSKIAMWIAARTEGDPMALAPAVRQATWSVDPEVPLSGLDRMSDVLGRSAGGTRFVTVLLTAFGGLALLLAMAGVYGVTAYTVTRRVPELGVRMALGAPRASVVRRCVAREVVSVAVGIAAGLALALPGSRLVETLLFGVDPTDPGTLAGVVLVLTGTALAATWLPARRASRLDPARVLRQE
jgi:predicted permease